MRMREKQYDLIFLDHMMPGKDGIVTLKELRAEKGNPNAETRCVCLTANAIPGAREYYISAGFDDYMSKPVHPAELEKLLSELLPKEKIVWADEENEDPKGSKETSGAGIPPELTSLKDSPFDVLSGINNCGAVSTYLPLLKMFYQSIDLTARELEGLYTVGDITNYTIKVHALKSSARLVGAMELGERAQKLEDAAKSGDRDYIDGHHRDFIREYIGFKDILSGIFREEKKEASSDKPEAEQEFIQEALAEILEACDEIDSDRIEEVLKGNRKTPSTGAGAVGPVCIRRHCGIDRYTGIGERKQITP